MRNLPTLSMFLCYFDISTPSQHHLQEEKVVTWPDTEWSRNNSWWWLGTILNPLSWLSPGYLLWILVAFLIFHGNKSSFPWFLWLGCWSLLCNGKMRCFPLVFFLERDSKHTSLPPMMNSTSPDHICHAIHQSTVLFLSCLVPKLDQ